MCVCVCVCVDAYNIFLSLLSDIRTFNLIANLYMYIHI